MKTSCALLIVICLWAPSCALEKEKPDAKPATKPRVEEPKLVGRIASIPADKRFVLIQSYGKWNIGSGSILTTRGPNERAANLLTTGEVLGEFAAADVQSGTLEIGDAVYLRPTPKPTSLPTPVAPKENDRTEPPKDTPKNI